MAGAVEEEIDDEDRRYATFLNDVIETLKNIPSVEKYANSELAKCNLLKVARNTMLQYQSVLWKELRYGRITASKLHEVAQCHTAYGATVKVLLGVTKIKNNKYLQRGRDLESDIIHEVEKIVGEKVLKTGLHLNENYPLFGATPDGITENFIVEVKAPFYTKTFENYITQAGEPTLKYHLQTQLQLLLCNKPFGYFCVANADFEMSKKVTVVKIQRNDDLLEPYLQKAQEFWERNIYPLLLKGALFANQ
ncbi:hypothetical protein B566_EDAN013304 [Ephemera danica]|nr:hypothetical protein B566_EDAN013304 [Ephemera danica]